MSNKAEGMRQIAEMYQALSEEGKEEFKNWLQEKAQKSVTDEDSNGQLETDGHQLTERKE